MTDDNKTPAEPSMDEPGYEDDTLGATMMEMDIAKLKKSPSQNQDTKAQESKEESVDELLKKQNSIMGRIGSIFGKK